MSEPKTYWTYRAEKRARSLANLTGPKRDWYVYERGATAWSKIFGPTTYRAAERHAEKLKALNNNADLQPTYTLGREATRVSSDITQ